MQKILISFPYDWAKYSPSFLGLCEYLFANKFQLYVVTPCDDKAIFEFQNKFGDSFRFHLVKKNKFVSFFIKLIDYAGRRLPLLHLLADHVKYLKRVYLKDIERLSKSQDFCQIILFDFYGLGSIHNLGQRKNITIYSLELETYLQKIGRNFKGCITTLISQSNLRAEFFQLSCKKFIVPNSYLFDESPLKKNTNKREGIIYSGTINKAFGYDWLQELTNSQEFSNTRLVFHGQSIVETFLIKNAKHEELNCYLEDLQLQALMQSCAVGLILYDDRYIESSQKFNFETAPSGKLFRYLGSGLPVIVNASKSMNIVTEFQAGIALKEINPKSIYTAYCSIINNYEYYQEGCRRLLEHNSFKANILPYIQQL